ncbi:MAG: hypothetical protein KF681_15115 [Bdellovibrionaceae bacterium]|nr:hypothetical protein [Pseudobdellovibrionaceae bacterium]
MIKLLIRWMILVLPFMACHPVMAQLPVKTDPVAFCRLRLFEGEVELGSTFETTITRRENLNLIIVKNQLLGECEGRLRRGSMIPGATNSARLFGTACTDMNVHVSMEPHDEPQRFTLWVSTADTLDKDRYLCTWVN